MSDQKESRKVPLRPGAAYATNIDTGDRYVCAKSKEAPKLIWIAKCIGTKYGAKGQIEEKLAKPHSVGVEFFDKHFEVIVAEKDDPDEVEY